MNDDFINKALPEVPKEFAQTLYERISADRPPISRPDRQPGKRISRRWQVALILLGVLGLVAWSQIRLWIRYVPIGDFWVVEFRLTESVKEAQTLEALPTPGQLPTAIFSDGTESITVYLLEIAYLSPGWIPAGFAPTQVPGAGDAYEESIGMWSNEAQETIRLFVVPRTGGARPYAPPGMYKEVQVNGQPAILVFGRLAPNPPGSPQSQRKWDDTLGLQLTWSRGNSIFTLETLGPYVTEADLIRMAESMKTASPAIPQTSPTP